MRRVLQHNSSFCTPVTHLECPKSAKHWIKGIVPFYFTLYFFAFIPLPYRVKGADLITLQGRIKTKFSPGLIGFA